MLKKIIVFLAMSFIIICTLMGGTYLYVKNNIYEENNLDIDDVAKYCHDQMETLYEEVKRTLMPHKYQVATTEEYLEYKDDVIEKERVKIKKI